MIGLDKLLFYFRISKTTYHNWLLNVKIKCTASYTELCTRKYGTQLTKHEANVIYNGLTNPNYSHWPVSSIAHYFKNQDWLQSSVATWYKYRKLFNIVRTTYRKLHKKVGIVSSRINEYWHIDITHVTTTDGAKHCVYFLCDNFSRKILSYRIAPNVSWQYVKECIEDAYAQAIEGTTISPTLDIITDGGPENTHHSLDEYINSLVGNIKKRIALKDIQFSNSPIEAKHRTFKTYYYNAEKVINLKALYEVVEFFLTDFNNVRPMRVLKGQTPNDVYKNTPKTINALVLQQEAIVKRIKHNKNSACNACQYI